jgi:hypothetical protein
MFRLIGMDDETKAAMIRLYAALDNAIKQLQTAQSSPGNLHSY